MAGYLQNYSSLACLLQSISDCKVKLGNAVHQRDTMRLARKLETEEELLFEAVADLNCSPLIEQILDEISFGSLEVLIEEIRDNREKLKAFTSQGNLIDAGRINRDLAPLNNAMTRICRIACEDTSSLSPSNVSSVEDKVSNVYNKQADFSEIISKFSFTF